MKKSHNKQQISQQTIKIIRKLFFQKVQMKEIEKQIQLTERVIRRVIKESHMEAGRMRYHRFLCHMSLSHGISLKKMAQQTGVNYYYLCRIRKKNNIPKAKIKVWNDRRSNKIEQEVVKLYKSGQTGQQIVDKIGYKRQETVYQILDKLGIDRREPKIQTYYDESFFEKIDSHEKAYILGLIMTDGNIIKDYNGFEIQLTEADGYILEKIGDLIGASKTHTVQRIDCSHKRTKKGFTNAKDMIRLTVHNRKIAEDLRELGVVKRKTKILRYNGCVPDEFLSSFFRGLVDGDGCMGVDKRGYPYVRLASASHNFICDLLSIGSIMDFKFSVCKQICKNGNYISILNVLGGKTKILKNIEQMYNDKGDFYLRRKYEKVQSKIN